jgi:hypothetical protein
MSAPVQDDDDKRTMYAPPWARQPQGSPPDVVEAASVRLRQERARLTAPVAHERDTVQARTEQDIRERIEESDDRIEARIQARAQARIQARGTNRSQVNVVQGGDPGDARGRRDLNVSLFRDRAPPRMSEETDLDVDDVKTVRDAWSPPPLEPVPMSPPPKLDLGGAPWGMIARMAGAVVVAALIALVVSGTLPLGAFDVWSSRHDERQEASNVAPAVHAREPVSQASAASDMPASGAVSAGVLSAFAAVDAAASAAEPAPLPSKSSPPTLDLPSAKADERPKQSEMRTIGRDEIEGLLKRGQALLKDGDISAARLVLRRAAEAGDANAMLMLAGSYDRTELAKLKVFGVAHDHAQAKIWYAKAAEQGSAEAARRLRQLAQRAD